MCYIVFRPTDILLFWAYFEMRDTAALYISSRYFVIYSRVLLYYVHCRTAHNFTHVILVWLYLLVYWNSYKIIRFNLSSGRISHL